jgi:hypothetical protein
MAQEKYSIQYWATSDFKMKTEKIEKKNLAAVKRYCKRLNKKNTFSGNVLIYIYSTNEITYYSPRA